MKIDKGIEAFGENLPQCHFVHHKSYMTSNGIEPSTCGDIPATNRMSCDTVALQVAVKNLKGYFRVRKQGKYLDIRKQNNKEIAKACIE
jgi:hypothetical protein